MPDHEPSGAVGAPSFLTNIRALFAVMEKRRRLQFIVAFILMFLGAVAELVTIGAVLPLLAITADSSHVQSLPGLQSVLDAIGVAPDGNLIVPAAILLIVAAVCAAFLRLLLTWVTQKFVYGLQYDITMRVYGRTIRQPYAEFVKQNSSAVISAIEKIYIVTIGIVSPLMLAATSAGMAVFIIAFLFLIDPVTAAVASLAMGALYVAITIVNRRMVASISQRAAAVRTVRVKLLQESLGGFRDIILEHSEEHFERKLARLESEMRGLQVKSQVVSLAPRFIVEGAGITMVALLSIYFSTKPGGILAALPVLGALALGAQRLLPLLQAMYLGWASYSIHAHTLQDVVGLLARPMDPARVRRQKAAVRPFGKSIELADVSFSYDGSSFALRDVDLAIPKGERIGLIGKTGSGKSTLVDLLMGLLRPTQGQMLIDGVPTDDGNIGNWQAQIAHVPQAIFLSDDSIAANIAFGSDEEIDMDRVLEAAERADIRSFIDQLPNGIMTEVGERGVRLSGGQRQRIGIARALYKQATVLILDEATSALDDKTEAAVMESVTGLGRDLTIIMIAHRLSTVAGCDTIYRLEGGRIVQKGSYAEVVPSAAVTPRSARRR